MSCTSLKPFVCPHLTGAFSVDVIADANKLKLFAALITRSKFLEPNSSTINFFGRFKRDLSFFVKHFQSPKLGFTEPNSIKKTSTCF